MNEPQLARSASSTWLRRDQVRAFYSGHSLSDGVPEQVEVIARALGQSFSFEVQTLGYSLLRERTKGTQATADYSGYRAGNNRQGSGLDVAAELRAPTRLAQGERYDALVVTERHDLPAIARDEQSATYLAHMAKQLLAGNPEGEVFFYHTWLDLRIDAPLPWVAYERSVRRLWECVASRANLELESKVERPVVRVLPGGSALAELVAELWEGKVPGLTVSAPAERVRLLFADNVHMSDLGRYYLALVHYAVLYGTSPKGAPLPSGLSAATGAHLQELAWRHVSEYGHVADAAVRRPMAVCRALMQHEICPQYHALRAGDGALGKLKQAWNSRRCASSYADADDPDNPFRDP